MTITTTQVSAEDALRAVADGKSVQMIWMNDGKPFFSDFTAKIRDAMAIGEAFLIVEVSGVDLVKSVSPVSEIEFPTAELHDAKYEIQPDIKYGTQQEPKEKIHPEESEAKPKQQGGRKPLDDGKIIALFHAGWPSRKIADEMGVQTNAINVHLRKLREEGRL